MRRIENLENCTWEDVFFPTKEVIYNAYKALENKADFFDLSVDDFKNSFVQEFWQEDENLGPHIFCGQNVFPLNSENWNAFWSIFNEAMAEIEDEEREAYYDEATRECEKDLDFVDEESFAEGETAGYYYDRDDSHRVYKIKSFESYLAGDCDYFVMVEYNFDSKKYLTIY